MIWVVGAKGMLGHDVVRRLNDMRFEHIASDLECDITNADDIRRFVGKRSLSWIVNCAGYTAVDAAEDEEERATQVNAMGPANLGGLAAEHGCSVIHLSTDYVFDGGAAAAYGEEHSLAPLGAYGRSKAAGERLLAEATPAHFIVRTAWLYGSHGKNFVLTMLRLMGERESVGVVDDQRGSPTYSWDLARALCEIIRADSRDYGIYHYVNEGQVTWYEFACAIHRMGRERGRLSRQCDVRPIAAADYPTKAVRPKFSVLSTEKIRRTFGVDVPRWDDALTRFLNELDEEST
jgi:dTDP-4-dehydrorhamnose reductase